MNFKKIITLLLAFTLTLSLAACGSKDAAPPDDGNVPPQEQGSGDAQPGPSTTASKPNAAALRSSVPTLPGSCTRSSARYRPPVFVSSSVCTGVRKMPNTP